MEAVGTLAGGVAHDFNNILTVLIGCGDLLRMKMRGDDPLRLYVDQMLASAEKAANLTQSLLAFSRKQQIKLKALNLYDVVKGTGKLLERVLSEDIQLKIAQAHQETVIMADPTQIEQILLNLAANARDAMPRGGLLSIETGVATLDNEFIKTHGYGERGKYALLSVSDTGIGMDETTKDHIFEPFFTTKEVGKGTGLGLSTVYGIVKQHNGYITVSSRRLQGTSFRIYLPLAVAKKTPEVPLPEKMERGTETILVAEDDSTVRTMTMDILNTYGYNTLEATDGQHAVEVFAERKEDIDLVLLDVVMPKKNGREAFEELRKIRPVVKVLFVSGYTGDVIIDKGVQSERIDFIQKPLSPNNLLRKVREILDR
jgi:CheY-like chemotaxis protein